MSFSEHDRGILRELKNILYEIRDVLLESHDLNKTALRYAVNKNNKSAQIHQDAMRYHLGLMEDANEEE